MGVHVHVRSCVCVYMNLSEYVQMSADVHISGKTDEDDRCECTRVCWEEEGGHSRVHDGKMSNRHGSTMTAL